MNLKLDRLPARHPGRHFGDGDGELCSRRRGTAPRRSAQITWLGVATVALLMAIYIPSRFVDRLSLVWVAVVVLLVLVLVMGTKVNGAKRWLSFGSLRISLEFAKLGVIFAFAHHRGRSRRAGRRALEHLELLGPLNPSRPIGLLALLIWGGERLGSGYFPLAAVALVWFAMSAAEIVRHGWRGRFVAPLDLILVPMVLINIEPDLGTSLVVLVCGLGVLGRRHPDAA